MAHGELHPAAKFVAGELDRGSGAAPGITVVAARPEHQRIKILCRRVVMKQVVVQFSPRRIRS